MPADSLLQLHSNLTTDFMAHLPHLATDDDLLHFADQWASLMETEDYGAAHRFTDQDPQMAWTPKLMQEVIKQYGECRPDQKVTVEGLPTDIRQRKHVLRFPENQHGCIGEIWYDLNIDGYVSDLTATFAVLKTPTGLTVQLSDIHVM